jgi:hypothetical protein
LVLTLFTAAVSVVQATYRRLTLEGCGVRLFNDAVSTVNVNVEVYLTKLFEMYGIPKFE